MRAGPFGGPCIFPSFFSPKVVMGVQRVAGTQSQVSLGLSVL